MALKRLPVTVVVDVTPALVAMVVVADGSSTVVVATDVCSTVTVDVIRAAVARIAAVRLAAVRIVAVAIPVVATVVCSVVGRLADVTVDATVTTTAVVLSRRTAVRPSSIMAVMVVKFTSKKALPSKQLPKYLMHPLKVPLRLTRTATLSIVRLHTEARSDWLKLSHREPLAKKRANLERSGFPGSPIFFCGVTGSRGISDVGFICEH